MWGVLYEARPVFKIAALCLALALVASVMNKGAGSKSEVKKERVVDMEFTITVNEGERTGTYSGEVIDGIPNGKGSFTAQNDGGTGWTYTGDFYDGQFDGNGRTEWDSGQWEEGYYIENEISDGETYSADDKLIYEGMFENGRIPEERRSPHVRMTENEVVSSSWGRPNFKDEITTEDGVFDKWIYYGKGYVYFENGIVVDIEDW